MDFLHGVTWPDGIALVLLLVFTIRGILRGTVAQVFAFFGLLAGIWTGALVAHWVGDHWRDARPAFVYAVLRWLVAALGGLAVATLLGWLGELVAKAVHAGPLGWLDRTLGGLIGFAVGAALSAVVMLVAVQAPGLGFARREAARGRLARPLVGLGARATGWRVAGVPGGVWLHAQFVAAVHRLPPPRSS